MTTTLRQPASDVAYTRDRPSLVLFSVKRDIETEDDTQLAMLELQGLTGESPSPLSETPFATLPRAAEAVVSAGAADRVLVGALTRDQLPMLQRRLAMVDEISFLDDASGAPVVTAQSMLELSMATSGRRPEIGARVSRTKNNYLSHGFHKYKAKFFPRMARALTNFVAPSGIVGDPYMGSGTLAVEASLLGVKAVGVDIDPLSVMIANLKTEALRSTADVFESALADVEATLASYTSGDSSHLPGSDFLPRFIASKVRDGAEIQVESELRALRFAVSGVRDSSGQQFMLLALSHSMATKVSLRWMGTGDPRFSLSVAKRSLVSIFFSHARFMIQRMRDRDRLASEGLIVPPMSGGGTVLGDARRLPWETESLDGIVTSPPYIPASSGRETYLRSRAPSLVALGLLSEAELIEREGQLVGSIERSAMPDAEGLPESVRDLVAWMLPQRARKPKALPTAAYFLDIAASLREIGRTLRPGAKAAMVLSHQHVFYDSSTREHVRTIVMPDIVQQLIDDPTNRIPLAVRASYRLPLPKMDYAARPASTGEYAEAIIVLQRV